MTQHQTPLESHLKHWHLWFDLFILLLIWVLASYFPLAKIFALVASLELMSFFSFHLMGQKKSLYLQGFLGGFVSSTAVYVQLTSDHRFKDADDKDLMIALILAYIAMLAECMLILFTFVGFKEGRVYLPFGFQLVVLCAFLILLAYHHKSEAQLNLKFEVDHPIRWKDVVIFSMAIIGLIFGMQYLNSTLKLPQELATFIVSLFEAHAVLAAIVSEWVLSPDKMDIVQLSLCVLLGNFISKMFLVIRARTIENKKWVISAIVISFFCTGLLCALVL